VIGYRTDKAKLGAYNFWHPGTIDIETKGMEAEVYNYSTARGQQELDNVSHSQPNLYKQLTSNLFNDAIPNELRKPLSTPELQAAQQQALKDYLSFAEQTTQVKSRVDKTDEHLQVLSAAIVNL
jgi:hypothetical protein